MTEVIHIRETTPGGSPDEIYIGRPGKKQPDAIFGNPVPKGQKCPVCGLTHQDNGSTLGCYEKYLNSRLEKDEGFAEAFWKLKGKKLVCFCRPKGGFGDKLLCHGQIMARKLDS